MKKWGVASMECTDSKTDSAEQWCMLSSLVSDAGPSKRWTQVVVETMLQWKQSPAPSLARCGPWPAQQGTPRRDRDDCAQGCRHTHTRTWDRPTVKSKQMYINPMPLLYLGWNSDLTLHNIWPITLPEVGKRVKHENRTSWNWMFEYHLTIWLENGCSCSSIIATIKTFHILNQ